MKNGIKKFFRKKRAGILIEIAYIEKEIKKLGYVNVQAVPRLGETMTLHTFEGMLFGEVIEVYHDLSTDYFCEDLGKVRHEATQQSITVFLKIMERD